MSEKTIEIYNLAKNLDKLSITTDSEGENVKVTVDLSKPEAENRRLVSQNLETPIKEAERFRLIKDAKYAKRLLENGEDSEDLKVIVEKGDRAVAELVEIFKSSAYNFAKNWIHNDRLNLTEDWLQIVLTTLHEAIMSYDMSRETQFNTHLNWKIKESCKEQKCKSSIMAVNATAMEKARQIKKIKSELEREGKNPEDIYLIAEKMGRDISVPKKLENFRKMLLDMENVSPQSISTESQVSKESRTFGESLESGDLSPEDYSMAKDAYNRFKNYCAGLDDESIKFLKVKLNLIPNEKIMNKERIQRRLCSPELHNIILDMQKYSSSKIDFYDFLR